MATIIRKSVSFYPEHIEIVEKFPSRMHGMNEFSAKVQEILLDYHYMLLRTKKEIEGVFTEKEWYYIRDMLNATMLPSTISYATMLVAQIEDAAALDGLDEKWEVDAKELARKISTLTEFQCYTVVKMSDEFWEAQLKQERS